MWVKFESTIHQNGQMKGWLFVLLIDAVNCWEYREWSMSMENWWNDNTGKNGSTWRKTCPRLLQPPKISHELTWDWTEASRLRGQQLTAWAMTAVKGWSGEVEVCALWDSAPRKIPKEHRSHLYYGKNLKSCSGALLSYMVIVGRLTMIWPLQWQQQNATTSNCKCVVL